MRSGLGRRASRLAHAAAYDGYDQNGLDVLQPGSRRSRQRSDYQRDRRFGRTNGPHHGPHDHPVPDAQPFEGRRHVESARPMRQIALLSPMAAHARKHREPLHLARCGDGAPLRHRRGQTPHKGCKDPNGHRVRLPRRRADFGNLSRRNDALRHFARRRGQGGGCRFARNHGIPARHRIRNGTHENRHSGASRRTHDRLRIARTAIRRRKSGQVLFFT